MLFRILNNFFMNIKRNIIKWDINEAIQFDYTRYYKNLHKKNIEKLFFEL